MTTQALPSETSMLSGRRFAVRFLGRPGAWLWFGATAAVAAVAWAFVAMPAHGDPGALRTWYLWSGNVLLVLFLATMLFVARKWSIKLPYFRDYGRAVIGRADACWAEIQLLNAKIKKGAFASDAEILAAALQTMKRFGVEKMQRAEVRQIAVGGRTVKFVQMSKKEPFGRLEPWLEMHMGIGVTACLAVLLHADFAVRHPVGWSLFLGSMIVLGTGLAGAALYRVIPEKLSKADAGIPYEEAGVARETHHECVEGVLATLDPKLRDALSPLLDESTSRDAFQERAASVLATVTTSFPDQFDLARDLVVMAGARDELLWSTAKARGYDRLLRVWRWIHVPVSAALFFVIALHIWMVVWF
jgi:hypothetical protein